MAGPTLDIQGGIEDAHTGETDVLQDQSPDIEQTPQTDAGDGGGEPQLDENGQPIQQTPEPDPLEGTPFRDVAGVVDAYKNIQRLVAAKDQRLQQLEGILTQLVQQGVIGPGKQPADAPKAPNPQEWFQQFALDPISTIQGLVSQAIKEQIETQVAPRLNGVEANVGQYQIDREVSDFITRNPEVTEKDEHEILKVLQDNPWMGKLPNKLDIAWDRIQAQRARDERRKVRQVEAVKDAKAAAGVGSKPAVVDQSGKDEFDAVLGLAAEERKVYGR